MLKYFGAFEVFFEENLPRLFNHFKSYNLTPDLYLIDWWVHKHSNQLHVTCGMCIYCIYHHLLRSNLSRSIDVCVCTGSLLSTVSLCRWTWRVGFGTCFAETVKSFCSGRVWGSCGCMRRFCCRWTSSTSLSFSADCRRTHILIASSPVSPTLTCSAVTGSGRRSVPVWVLTWLKYYGHIKPSLKFICTFDTWFVWRSTLQ